MNIRKWLVLQIIYFKRLFLKKSFVILLCLVPIMVLGLRLMVSKDNGVVSIALCMEDDNCELAERTVNKILESDSIISFSYYADEKEATEKLERGSIDAVWIFPEDMEERVRQYASGDTHVKLVKILEIEDTTSLRLSREALLASFYDEISYEEYIGYVVKAVPEGTEIDDEELREYYEYFRQDESLFEYYNIDGTEWKAPTGYLTAPVRGMLALLILLAGIAGVMYFRQDKESGVYDYLESSGEWIYKLSGQMTAMILIGGVSLISMYVSGNAVGFGRELLLLSEYIIACALFCSLMDKLLGSLLIMGIVTPFVVLTTFILCPVFFNINGLMPVRCMLPAYYYLLGIHDNKWIIYGGIYIAAALILNIITELFMNRGIGKYV